MQLSDKLHKQFNYHLSKFQGKLKRPEYKFVRQMTYGILAGQHVHLNKIGSLLGEKIRLKKTTERLSRHLGKAGLDHQLLETHLQIHRRQLQSCDYLIGDLSDISKTYACCMEGLERVYDGSKGEIANGYWLMNLIAIDKDGERILPAYSELYALNQPDELDQSENSKILNSIDTFFKVAGKDQIVVFDRGGDRRILLQSFIRKGRYFVIRQVGNRDLHDGKQRQSLKQISRRIKLDTSITVCKYRHGKQRQKVFDCGAMRVYLPRERGDLYWPTPLWLVVAKEKGKGYCWFLCHLPTTDKTEAIRYALQGYGLRWKIEEVHRQIKSDYHLEAVCLRRYQALKNFNAIFWISLSLIYYHFDQWRIELLTNADIKVCYQEKWWEYRGFVYYKIARVVADFLRKIRFTTIALFRCQPPDKQLDFGFA